MAEDRSGGIASFGVSLGEQRQAAEDGEKSAFRIVVVAEVVAGADWSTGRTPPLDPIPIDAESFDRVMGQLSPSFAIDVDDPFGEGEPALRVDLIWRDRKSMRPNEIVQQVPALRALAEARRVVLDVASRRRTAEDGRAELTRMLPRASWANALVSEVRAATPKDHQPAPAAAPQPGSVEAPKGGLDALFDMVDVSAPNGAKSERAPAGTSEAPPTEISRIVAEIARSARKGAAPTPRAIVGSAPERLERAFQNLLSSILRHPEVRRLERAWRGLRLLVEHADKRAGVEVDVLSASSENIDEALSRLVDVNVSRAPVDLLVLDRTLGPTAADLGALEKWAARAESMLAPLIVGGQAEMVGGESLGAIARSTSALSASDDPRAIAVRAVAARETSRWVAIVLNDPLARVPYTPTTGRQSDPAFEEDASDLGAHVFTNGAFVVAALCARSFARLGWPTSITGARDGAIGNLPVHTVSDRGATSAVPLEVIPSEDAVREVARAGLTMLTCAPNSDAAVLSRAPVLHRLGGGNGATTATLADQLFVGRFARAVQQVAAAIPHDTDTRAAEEVARISLMELFANAPPAGPEVAAKVDGARGQLAVTVRPRRFAGISLEEITLGAALG
jgi:type VI secretion system ImpB/VipA family protein